MKQKLLTSALLLLGVSVCVAQPNTKLISTQAQPRGVEKVNAKAMRLQAAPAVTNVVSTKTLSNGSSIQWYKAADGMVRKVLTKNGASAVASQLNKMKSTRTITKSVAATDPLLFEGFEGYDGKAYDWIPANWQDVSKTNPAHVAPGADSEKLNLTWCVDLSGTYFSSYEGDYMARIQTSIPNETTGEVLEAQDEWLISPAVTVSESDYLLFYLSYSPGWTLFDMNTFGFTAENSYLEVQVSTDNGASWEKIWDVLDDAKKYTEEELWNDVSSMTHPYTQFYMSLGKFAGESIQVAFRYVGENGESMCLDNVQIGALSPVASYARPKGAYNVGFSPDFYNLNTPTLLGPAYHSLTWTNTSAIADGAKWNYVDPSDETSVLSSEEENLVTPVYAPMSQVDVPTLVSTFNGVESDPFKLDFKNIQNGGFIRGTISATESTEFGVCNYNYLYLGEGETDDVLSYAVYFGVDDKVASEWAKLMSGQIEGVDSVSIIEMFDAPEVPYALSGVYMMAAVEALDPSTVIRVNIYKLNENGFPTDIIATGSVSASEVELSPGNYVPISIPIIVKDGDLIMESSVDIDQAIAVEITGFNPATDKVYPANVLTSSDRESSTNVGLYYKGQLYGFVSYSALEFTNGKHSSGALINLNIQYNWIKELNDSDYKFEAPVAGGSKTFEMTSSIHPDYWIFEDSNNALYDWVTPSANYDETTGDLTLTFTATELPEGVAGRLTDVTVSIPAASAVFRIAQGDVSGVEGVVAPAVIVTVENGNFVVNGSEVSSVDVYNIAGQRVASAAIQGETVIDGQNLAKGVYILKFNNNKTVKIVK